MTFTLYIEGGGDNRRLAAQFREGWTRFLAAAGLSGHMPRVVRGGSREQTFKQFTTEVARPGPGTLPLLLVDSEVPVAAEHSVWEHLHAHDRWSRPASTSDDDAFLMVQAMETWFLADRDAMRAYFGPRFVESALRRWPELEAVPKATVFDALKRATASCPKRYSKGKVSFELLAQVDPVRVESACPHATMLLDRLRTRCRP